MQETQSIDPEEKTQQRQQDKLIQIDSSTYK